MFCKHCGMQSTTTDHCSWCKRELSPASKPSLSISTHSPTAAPRSAGTPAFAGAYQESVSRAHPPAPGMPLKRPSNLPAPVPTAAGVRSGSRSLEGLLAPQQLEDLTRRQAEEKRAPEIANRSGSRSLELLTGGAEPMPAQGTEATQAMPVNRRTTPEPEEEVGGLAAGKAAPVRQANLPRLPTMEIPGTQPSKYYSGQLVDPVSGKHYDPATGKPKEAAVPVSTADVVLNWDEPVQTAAAKHLAVYATALVGLLVAAGVASYFLKPVFAIPMILAQFVGALLLPVLRVAPWQDEDSDDVVAFLLMSLLFGPGIALIAYGALAAVRQTLNPAVLGMLVVSLLARVVTAWAAGSHTLYQLAPWNIHSAGQWPVLLLNWSGLIALAGWYTAGFFHKLHE